MTVAKKPVSKTTPKPKAPPAKKFGEVGFKFPVMAEIISVSTDDDEWGYPVVVKIDMGDYEDWTDNFGGAAFQYPQWKNFKEFYAKCDPKFVKTQKQEELKQAKAVVAKLEKELLEIK